MKTFLQETFIDFVSLFYPHYCFACNDGLAKGEEIVCTKCRLDLPRANYHLQKDNPLYRRLGGRFPLHFAMSFLLFRKGGKVQNLLHALKYKNHPEIGVTLGKVYGMELAETNYRYEIDVIVPIPLHFTRKRKRGYNQSEEFAKGLSETLQIPIVNNAVERITKTESQTRKNKLKRWQNVSDVFKINDESKIRGKRILLVDDVITTGATVEACANVLIEQTQVSIGVASIAYAQEGK